MAACSTFHLTREPKNDDEPSPTHDRGNEGSVYSVMNQIPPGMMAPKYCRYCGLVLCIKCGAPHFMREIRMSGLMSGDGKRGNSAAPVLDSTDQGQEAASAGRRGRSADMRHRPRRRHPGPRWRAAADGRTVRSVPISAQALADSDYQGPKFKDGLKRACRQINLEIVKRSDVGKFVVLPKRWIVERTIGWLNRCRRLAKDWECLNRNALAFLRWASIRMMMMMMMMRELCLKSSRSRMGSELRRNP
jgi:transposase